MQAATLAGAGRPSDALTVLDEILGTSAVPSATARFHLLRGDLLLAVGEIPASAETEYLRCLEMARSMGAIMVELQAQGRLCRLRRGRGEVDDGGVLRLVYDKFTEGFATRDLSAARELLEAG